MGIQMDSNFVTNKVGISEGVLKAKMLEAALVLPEFKTDLSRTIKAIRAAAVPTATEATIESAFERHLFALLRTIGLEFSPDKEVQIYMPHLFTSKRMDSRIGALVIEYKKPSILKTEVEIDAARDQLHGYLLSLSDERPDLPFVGFLTNGLKIMETRALGGRIVSTGPLNQVDDKSMSRFIEHFISLPKTALTPNNLIRDFCGNNSEGVIFELARIFHSSLEQATDKTNMLHAEWAEAFRLSHDDSSQQKRVADRRKALKDLFGTDINGIKKESKALFALHSAYAVLLKFMAYRTISDAYHGKDNQTWTTYAALADTSSKELRRECASLEDGEQFRDFGIVNLLEGDFFSWYCSENQWSDEIKTGIQSVIRTLARYEDASRIFESNDAPDIFRDLYQATVPAAVRSSLGEFYTPFWLAEKVLDSVVPKKKKWRALDPCCGSGSFVIASIARVRKECIARNLSSSETLDEILSRVSAVDLNPLSVLTSRINYFIHISSLLKDRKGLVIPVFLGDAAALPSKEIHFGVECARVQLATLKLPIDCILPVSLIKNTSVFMHAAGEFEKHIKRKHVNKAADALMKAVPEKDRQLGVHHSVRALTERLIDLERQGWNGIWARILSNFLTVACLDKFDLIIGNPPWVDWKNLPGNYRDGLKPMCLEHGLFSGAGRTGGINLNICGVITYVSLNNWLAPKGKLAFLMPKELIFQPSYEGWRRLNGRWSINELHDWSKAGNPFHPVTDDFMTYVIGEHAPGTGSIPVKAFKKKKNALGTASEWANMDDAMLQLDTTYLVADKLLKGSTAYGFGKDEAEISLFKKVAGVSHYIGRDGLQLYPQELLVFNDHNQSLAGKDELVTLKNIQVQGALHKVPQRVRRVEKTYLRPLLTAPNIERFCIDIGDQYVHIPYEEGHLATREVLEERAEHLLKYYEHHKDVLTGLSAQNKIVESGSDLKSDDKFWSIPRIGPYSFADVHVVFRKDTKWLASVVEPVAMPDGSKAKPAFLSHVVSMCEREDRTFIDVDEAHYICAIINTPIVERMVLSMSGNRSFKVRPPVFIPRFDSLDGRHAGLSASSKKAHEEPEYRDNSRVEAEKLYLSICNERP